MLVGIINIAYALGMQDTATFDEFDYMMHTSMGLLFLWWQMMGDIPLAST